MKSKKELMQYLGARVIHNGESKLMSIHDKKDFKQVLFYSENKDREARNRLICEPMDNEWKNHLRKNKVWWYLKEKRSDVDLRMYTLRDRLLSFAGEATCFAYVEEDIDDILEYGQFWLGHGAKMMRGQASRCHSNVSELWELNHKDHEFYICTGYALSKDGMWRQHSWGILKTPRSIKIIETTTPRIAYYGFAMDEKMAEKFADENW